MNAKQGEKDICSELIKKVDQVRVRERNRNLVLCSGSWWRQLHFVLRKHQREIKASCSWFLYKSKHAAFGAHTDNWAAIALLCFWKIWCWIWKEMPSEDGKYIWHHVCPFLYKLVCCRSPHTSWVLQSLLEWSEKMPLIANKASV